MITQVESLDAFGEPLTDNYPAYTAGQVMLETAERLVVEESEPAVQQYLLLVGALRALNHGTSDGTTPTDVDLGLLPAAGAGHRRLRAIVLRLRALWSRRTASSILARNGRCRLRTLPPRGSRATRTRDIGVARCAPRGPLA